MNVEKCNAILGVLLDSAKEKLNKVTESAKETVENVVEKAEEKINDLELKAAEKTINDNLIAIENLLGKKLSDEYRNFVKKSVDECLSKKDTEGLDEINKKILASYDKLKAAKILISEAGIE